MYNQQRTSKQVNIENFNKETFTNKLDFTIKDSFILPKGERGLFANKNYNKGDIIEICPTLKMSKHELDNKKIVTTGFRFDKQMLEKLSKIGVKIQDTINKQTDILIVKDEDEDSGKVTTAKEKGIPIITKKEFMDKYKI